MFKLKLFFPEIITNYFENSLESSPLSINTIISFEYCIKAQFMNQPSSPLFRFIDIKINERGLRKAYHIHDLFVSHS